MEKKEMQNDNRTVDIYSDFTRDFCIYVFENDKKQ